MHDWHTFVRDRLPPLECPPECEAEIVEEIAIQLDSLYRAALGAGSTEDEAYARVVAEVPDWPALASSVVASKYPRTAAVRRHVSGSRLGALAERRGLTPSLTALWKDLTYSMRALGASPMFTFATAVTLALGVGAATAVFSLVHAVLLAPLPLHDAARLVFVQQVVPEIADRYPVLGANPRSIRAWTTACRSTCEQFAVLRSASGTLTGAGEAEGLIGARISPNFFATLGLPLLGGREFTPADDRPGADDVVILSDALWRRRFGGDRSVVGSTIDLDGRRTQVVGIADSAGLGRIEDLSELRVSTGAPEFFKPLAWTADLLRSAGEYDNAVLIRMTPGATPGQVTAELDAITDAEFRSEGVHPRTRVRPVRDQILGPWQRPMLLLLASVLAALAIGCVNIANLLGGPWLGRRRELAIRSAMGAHRFDLLRLMASETFLLAAVGGAAGLLIAWGGLRGLIHVAPAGIPRLDSVRLDVWGFAFAAVTALCCGLVCLVVPARQVLRREPGETLKAGALTTTAGPGATTVRRLLVAVEIALTSALLVLGGSLVLSLYNVLRVHPGFEPARVLAVDLRLPEARYPHADSRARFFDALLLRVQSAPGVEAAGIIRVLPLEGEATVDAVAAVGDTRRFAQLPVANHLQVSPGYFRALGLPLVAGRWLSPGDYGRNVALVSENTARLVWPNQNPIGRRFSRANRNRDWEVVGVVADARLRGLDKQAGLVTYVPYWTGTASAFALAVRTFGEPETAFGAVRQAVAALDPQIPLQRVRTMEMVLERTLATRRFQMRMMLAFAGAGLLLACLGVYAVISAGVEGRAREFAVRLAVGATPNNIVRAVLGEAIRPLAAGLSSGVAMGVAAAVLLRSLLFEVRPYEPVVILVTVTVMLGMGLAVCLAPAMRAMRTDPVRVLRQT